MCPCSPFIVGECITTTTFTQEIINTYFVHLESSYGIDLRILLPLALQDQVRAFRPTTDQKTAASTVITPGEFTGNATYSRKPKVLANHCQMCHYQD